MLNLLCICLSILSSFFVFGQEFHMPARANTEVTSIAAYDQSPFLQPVRFTNHGLRCFIRHAYNRPEYGTEFLPNNFFHFVQFLKRETPQKRSYYQSVLRMFGNKLKQSMYVNPYAFSQMLDETLPLFKTVCSNGFEPAFKNLQTQISTTMYTAMLDRFDYLKIDPDAYFSDLSQDIISLINSNQELASDASIEELRKSIMTFFELTINKLVWSPNEYEQAWRNVKVIADQLSRLYEKDILNDQDDLNDLFISLIERFCLFIDLSYAELPLDFYNTLRTEIAAKNLLLLELEQEQFIESKSQRLAYIIDMAEAKTRAYHAGIIVS